MKDNRITQKTFKKINEILKTKEADTVFGKDLKDAVKSNREDSAKITIANLKDWLKS